MSPQFEFKNLTTGGVRKDDHEISRETQGGKEIEICQTLDGSNNGIVFTTDGKNRGWKPRRGNEVLVSFPDINQSWKIDIIQAANLAGGGNITIDITFTDPTGGLSGTWPVTVTSTPSRPRESASNIPLGNDVVSAINSNATLLANGIIANYVAPDGTNYATTNNIKKTSIIISNIFGPTPFGISLMEVTGGFTGNTYPTFDWTEWFHGHDASSAKIIGWESIENSLFLFTR